MTRLYVGNLPWTTTEEELTELFSDIGKVHSCNLIFDRETGRSRGFGFVDLEGEDASRAIAELNGKNFGGRPLRVNEAQERQRRPGGGGDGGGGGGGRW